MSMKIRKNSGIPDKKRRISLLLGILVLAVCVVVIALCIREMVQKQNETAEKGSGNTVVETDEKTQKDKNSDEGKTTLDEQKKQGVEEAPSEAEQILSGMTLEEKAAQLFIVTPEALSGEESTTQAGEQLTGAFQTYPVGGFIMMSGNVASPQQIVEFNSALEDISIQTTGLKPFLSVDEEGGTVVRVAGNEMFPVENVGNMSDIAAEGNPDRAYEVGAYIGTYLAGYGFNVDFAPDADVWTNPSNEVVRYRAFGSDAQTAASMVARAVEGFHSAGVCTSLKHFPGHGATAEDSHEGFAYSQRTLEELRTCEFLPFQAGIEAGSEFVMVGHITLPQVTGDGLPSSLSGAVVTDLLRTELGYEGIIITDAMNMGAIAENYSAADAAVRAIQAGIDVILMPSDFYGAYQGILDAVQTGTLTEERLDESVERIIELKLKL